MAQVTSPIILDSTGQQIHSDLQQIKNVLTTPSAAADITFDNTGTGMQADDVQDALTELKSNLTDKLKLTVIRSLATWNIGSNYIFSQDDWDKYTEFHVFIAHANIAEPSYYEIVFNKYFFSFSRIVGYGGASGAQYVQMKGTGSERKITLVGAKAGGADYNPQIAIYGR